MINVQSSYKIIHKHRVTLNPSDPILQEWLITLL